MALKILRMLKNNWKKLVMLKKTMLLFFMPLLINCLIKIILKICIYSGRCSIQLLQVCLLPEEKTKELPEEAFDDKENNAFVLHAIIDKLFNKNRIKNLYLLRSLLNSIATSLSSSRGKD